MVVLVYLLFLLMFGALVSVFVIKSAESKAYKGLVANPCDDTVKAYIKYLNLSHSILFKLYYSTRGVQERNDMRTQALSWDVVKDSSAVSQEAKESLRTALLSNGVAIK